MGVWIETPYVDALMILISVTPCVGVWIETVRTVIELFKKRGHTLRGCVD